MKKMFILIWLFFVSLTLKSQIFSEVPKVPSYILNSNLGTEFYLSSLPVYRDTWGNYYWHVFIFSSFETEVNVKNKDLGINSIYKLTPNKIGRINVAGNQITPYYPFEGKSTEEKVYRNASLQITSKDPIGVFLITDVAYTADVISVLPTSSWGKEYVVNSYYSHNSGMQYDPPYNLASSTLIFAGFDSTIVEFTMIGNSNSKTLSGIVNGETRSFVMHQGDVLPLATVLGQNSTLAGSKIIAKKPIGVISGVQCAEVPIDIYPCDNLMEMELPTNTWGKTFHITKNKNREIGYLFQVVAKDTNTSLFINGVLLKLLEKNDTTFLVDWAEFNRLGEEFEHNFVLSADKLISITVFNQSGMIDSSNIDPYQMVITPLEQYRNDIYGMNFKIGDASGYPFNFLNVVYPLDSDLKMPEDFLWGETYGDTMMWLPFNEKWGNTADFVFEGFQDGKKYATKFLTLDKNTFYQIRCNEKIAAFAYGHSPYDSYGVPAYLGLRDLTVQDSLAPLFSFVQSADGTIRGLNGNEKAMITDLYHPLDSSSKLSMVYSQFYNTVNYDVQIDRFIPGDDASAYFTATVVDKSKDAQFVLTAIDRAGNDTTILVIQKATISSVKDIESEDVLRVIPSVTDQSPITIEIHNENNQPASLSIVSITGKTVHTFDNIHSANGIQTIQYTTAELPIGMYYVVYSMNGQQYQKSFVKMK